MHIQVFTFFFCDINWLFGFHANGRNSRILRSWEPWWIYVILLFGGHEIATPTRWGIAMITTSTDLPIYTLNLFKGTQVSVISTALHVLEVQDSVAWAKGSIFKNDSIERIGQSLDTAEKSKLTLPSVYIPLPFPLQLLPSSWMVGNMRCLKLQWKISHRFVGIQFGSINSSTLSFSIDPFQPAKQRWNQEYMYLQVCGPRVWRWPRLRQIWITWLAGTLTWF